MDATYGQMRVALDLIQLILNKNQQEFFTKDEVLNTFRSSLESIMQYSPVQKLLGSE